MKLVLTLIFIQFLIACNSYNHSKTEKSKAEILQTEKDFCQMAMEQGIAKAFVAFADDSAVIRRDRGIIKGKEEIAKTYNNAVYNKANLIWEADFVDVSESGDLGYTYGKYTFESQDSLGNKIESKGIFHTVWKRQKDGSWKFVWD